MKTGHDEGRSGSAVPGSRTLSVALVHSAIDPAGVNISSRISGFIDDGTFQAADGIRKLEFHEVGGRLIHEQGLDQRLETDLIIFLSRHTSQQPSPSLTVHVTGNIAGADLGGDPRSLSLAAPAWMHAVLNRLAVHAPPGYRVSYEVTHHGPSDLATPSFFVEIGSTLAEWTDEAAGTAAGLSVLEAVPGDVVPLAGFGGNHYAARQTAIALSTRAAFGHICPARLVPDLDLSMVRRMVEASGAVAAYIDKKSLNSGQLASVTAILSQAGVMLVSESELVSLKSIPWETYLAIGQIADAAVPGSRPVFHAIDGDGTPTIFTLPATLLQEVIKCSPDGLGAILDRLPVVHLAGPDGGMLPIFISYEEQRSRLIHELIRSCVKLIINREKAAIDGENLVIRRMRFDPGKARSLGVPKGPLFGRLAGGEEVEVDGVTITPSMVSDCSTLVIHVPGLERYL